MARFVSKYRGFSFVIRPTRSMLLATGGSQTVQEPLVADFRLGGLSPWEVETALEKFNFGAKGYDEDVTKRLSHFDTETAQIAFGWSDADRELVEKRLRERAGVDFVEVEQPRVPLPWPKYDQAKADRIAAKVVEDGYDPWHVIAYERENSNRPKVLEALEELTKEPVSDETVVSA